MVKSYQFQLMEVLKDNGFRQVSLPVQTLDGRYCYWGEKDWWVLNSYMPSDEHPPWESRDLIAEAAQTLAALHSAGRRYEDELRSESAREDLGWYYVPSTRWAELSAKIAGAFRWSELSDDDVAFLRSQLHFVQSNAAAIKSLCDERECCRSRTKTTVLLTCEYGSQKSPQCGTSTWPSLTTRSTM